MKKKAQVILALDVDSSEKAKYFVNKLFPQIGIFKVGSQLFTATGPEIVRYINKKGAGVFLDLKFFDIPNTVANAVRQAVRLKVKMLSLHISGGEEMLREAVKAAKQEARSRKLRRPLLIGVTVLTSKDAKFSNVLKLAKIGLACGLDGIVCSVREARRLRDRIKRKFFIITPGIRPYRSPGDDQKRTATAREAIQAGSNFLVIGRPILGADNPLAVVQQNTKGLNLAGK